MQHQKGSKPQSATKKFMPVLSFLKNRTILVTGGAGDIGSHTTRQLVNADCNVVVVDNFYSGNHWAVPKEANRRVGDPPALISDPQRSRELFAWRLALPDINLICEPTCNWEKPGAPD